ncbi:G-type lectin S-receptor-like serine/threonine-protein kinase [Actinidia chinensis var. chinensis]|uniref:Receptor-like serine/threonine-protein kinase n=1 Tax=Actinidia chinensis var. chinensis TaxID=1590841 RepID=A0A2R6QA21_ACTCC|nr:G-type lectin S-receptor-like serine/threonine-protein kinase [Actinidia chinensis var. chinensis]
MGTFLSLPLLFLFLAISSETCLAATDTLTQSQPITVGQTLTSSGQIFELGFFSLNNSGKQYVGIWYKNVSVLQVLWVANRDNPIAATDSTSSLTIGIDGNLRILDGKGKPIWETNVSTQTNNSIAELSDKGNFVLKDSVSGWILWQSFGAPGNVFLPGMMIGMNTKTGEKHFCTSWKTEDDPSPGEFIGGTTSDTPPQAMIWRVSEPYWRSGPWDGSQFLGIADRFQGYANGFSFVIDNQLGSVYFTFNKYNISDVTFLVLTLSGSWKIMHWGIKSNTWYVTWEQPNHPCDTYGFCGALGVCNRNGSRNCECLKGFVPKSLEEWSKSNWTSGCVRKTELLCEKNRSILASGRGKNDGFSKLKNVKLPDKFKYIADENSQGCKEWCLRNCSCAAYAHVSQIGCMVWAGNLMDIQQFPSSAGEDLFLRLASSELGKDDKKEKLIVGLTTASGAILLVAVIYGLYRWRANRRGKKETKTKINWSDKLNHSTDMLVNRVKQNNSLEELPLIDFDEVAAATNHFSLNSKLGEGGFGPVFKGKLQDGQEIAVKRLSRCSGQGIEEFKNEIILISRLQHRNLVRLLGCCIEGEEMLIVYEFMPNKSLDTFLFDPNRRGELDWAKRFNIIQGIARGLLYLHRDSCLKIIHRDLKASNILLDEDMNPKISDFGLARTFLYTQELANTHKVVGTYGYMSPEYAMGGIFSEKSDVFSFGVLLLEIVSGRKNTSFYHNEQYTSLLGYAWVLWNEGSAMDFMDQALAESFSLGEVIRCINVALLCVQDFAADRPTMSHVVLMLSSKTDCPQPKQPTFTFQSLFQSRSDDTANVITTSIVEGR